MKCPHCLQGYHSSAKKTHIGDDDCYSWWAMTEECPDCKKLVVILLAQPHVPGNSKKTMLVYPKGFSRAPISADVPPGFAQDYTEACAVLNDSPKASAALSRRCLQSIIREKAGIKKSDLNQEIGELLKSGTLPTYLASSVDAVRTIGNFAAHPIKSKSSGEIFDVEPGEAEWGLDVLEGLFDFYFVLPAELQRKRDELNKKLTDAGKPSLKKP